MTTLAPRPHSTSAPLSQSVVEDASDTESDPDLDAHLDPDQQQFYQRQQEQAMYYQQHQQQYGSSTDGSSSSSSSHMMRRDEDDEEMFSDDDSSTASIPDEDINFELTYALHTFLATVEGQASVVKGDSSVLSDDANSYWWLVRVLKTEDVGYIPAENIETPYERSARLNKHRNVDLAAATAQEKQAGAVQGRDRLKGKIGAKAKHLKSERSGDGEESASRRVIFAPPTYVEHPGVTWSTDGEDSGEEGDEDYDGDEVEGEIAGHEAREGSYEGEEVDRSLDEERMEMEPDDGVEWADGAARDVQRRASEPKPKSNNPFVRQREVIDSDGPRDGSSGAMKNSNSSSSSDSSNGGHLDPAQAGETKRITATPSVAQVGNGPLLPSAIQSSSTGRNVSGQSVNSVASGGSTASSARSSTPTSPSQQDDGGKKAKKMKKPSKDDSDGGEKKRSKGVLGGLFSRNKDKSKKGISSSDPRASEDSIVSGAVDGSPSSLGRAAGIGQRSGTAQGDAQNPAQVSHSLRLQQRDQAIQQAYTDKYLTKSSSGDVRSASASEGAASAQQASTAARFASMNGSGKKRPSSIILSPNPEGPPLLNVVRVFAGDHIKSDSTFKTVSLNETITANDSIRQLQQRFHLPNGASADSGYYLTIKDVSGEELESTAGEKPLAAFQEAVQRWAADDDEPDHILRAMTPTIKRSSISSISSVISSSAHPAIAKLGMNDFSDDSAVKIYLHKREAASQQGGMPEPTSQFSSYSTQLSSVQESSPDMQSSESVTPGASPSKGDASNVTASPPTPQARYNPSLTVSTGGQHSPERYSSPSARFTVQSIIHPEDLPDGSEFDPSSDAIVAKQIARKRRANDAFPMDCRKRLFQSPRNATVVEAIEQGLNRFGIQEGVVQGGDDIDDKMGGRRSTARVQYSLVARLDGQDRNLFPSTRVLDAYPIPPQLKPVERMTVEQRRRSRDLSSNAGSPSDILPTDPMFVLRRVQQRPMATGPSQKQQATLATTAPSNDDRGPLSPQEIIAAQRAASRANQKALISAHANAKQGIDVVSPDRGTLRSSRQFDAEGEVVRYSYIDGNGETYDISEILEEEWGTDTARASPQLAPPPSLVRTQTDSSNYVTAPSTPDPEANKKLEERPRSQDILQGVLQRASGQTDDALEERSQRVINKIKSGGTRPVMGDDSIVPATTGRVTPQGRSLATVPEGRPADVTPRASDARSNSRQANYTQTAVSVNRIVSRHRQQPSIASIMSDISASPAPESHRDPSSTRDSESQEDERDLHTTGTGTSTPSTATSSTHPTPPFSNIALFTRSVSSASPTPRHPVSYTDDFGIKNSMAVIDVRSRVAKPKSVAVECDEVEKRSYGQKIEWDGVQADVRGVFEDLMGRSESFDRDIDDVLASALKRKTGE